MSKDFACPECGSPAIRFPEVISSAAAVVCGKCQAFICTVSEFRLAAEPILVSDQQTAAIAETIDADPVQENSAVLELTLQPQRMV